MGTMEQTKTNDRVEVYGEFLAIGRDVTEISLTKPQHYLRITAATPPNTQRNVEVKIRGVFSYSEQSRSPAVNGCHYTMSVEQILTPNTELAKWVKECGDCADVFGPCNDKLPAHMGSSYPLKGSVSQLREGDRVEVFAWFDGAYLMLTKDTHYIRSISTRPDFRPISPSITSIPARTKTFTPTPTATPTITRSAPKSPNLFAKANEVVDVPVRIFYPATEKYFEIYTFYLRGNRTGILVWDPGTRSPVIDKSLVAEIIQLYLGYKLYGSTAQDLMNYYSTTRQQFNDLYNLTDSRRSIGLVFTTASRGVRAFFDIFMSATIPSMGKDVPFEFLKWLTFILKRSEEAARLHNTKLTLTDNFQGVITLLNWMDNGRDYWDVVDAAFHVVDIVDTIEIGSDVLKNLDDIGKQDQALAKLTKKLVPLTTDLWFDSGLDAAMQEDIATLAVSSAKVSLSTRAWQHAKNVKERKATPEDVLSLLRIEETEIQLHVVWLNYRRQSESKIFKESPMYASLLGINPRQLDELEKTAAVFHKQVEFARGKSMIFQASCKKLIEGHYERIR